MLCSRNNWNYLAWPIFVAFVLCPISFHAFAVKSLATTTSPRRMEFPLCKGGIYEKHSIWMRMFVYGDRMSRMKSIDFFIALQCLFPALRYIKPFFSLFLSLPFPPFFIPLSLLSISLLFRPIFVFMCIFLVRFCLDATCFSNVFYIGTQSFSTPNPL